MAIETKTDWNIVSPNKRNVVGEDIKEGNLYHVRLKLGRHIGVKEMFVTRLGAGGIVSRSFCVSFPPATVSCLPAPWEVKNEVYICRAKQG